MLTIQYWSVTRGAQAQVSSVWTPTPSSNFKAELRHPFLQRPLVTIHPEEAVCFQGQWVSLEMLEMIPKQVQLRSHYPQSPLQLCCSITRASSFIPLCLRFLISRVRVVMAIYVELMLQIK